MAQKIVQTILTILKQKLKSKQFWEQLRFTAPDLFHSNRKFYFVLPFLFYFFFFWTLFPRVSKPRVIAIHVSLVFSRLFNWWRNHIYPFYANNFVYFISTSKIVWIFFSGSASGSRKRSRPNFVSEQFCFSIKSDGNFVLQSNMVFFFDG